MTCQDNHGLQNSRILYHATEAMMICQVNYGEFVKLKQ